MRSLTLFALLVLTALSACSARLTAPGNAASASMYAIIDVTIVDVEKGTTLPGQTVVIVNHQIESVFLRGRYFSREELDQLLLEARELAQQPVSPYYVHNDLNEKGVIWTQ